MSCALAFKVLGVCAIDMRESGSMVLPIVVGCNLFKFIISAVFLCRGVCVCTPAPEHLLYHVLQTLEHGENKSISSFLW